MSDPYRTILAAVDLSDDSHQVVARAMTLARAQGAALTLLHVIEVATGSSGGTKAAGAPAPPLTDELEASARKRFDALSERVHLGDVHQVIRIGALREEIVALASEQSADLIVLGSRERHGLAMILNLTEDTVLHAAPCDVLAVRITSG
ncbi:MAG: universal stress protein [Pseudomonadota bacterium]